MFDSEADYDAAMESEAEHERDASRDAEYHAWIADFFRKLDGRLLGRCKEACEKMRKTFPELTLVPGHVHCAWGKRGHWWLTTPSGYIVDPTRDQFPGPVDYEPWAPGDEVRVGRCMNCGEDIWRPMDDPTNPPPNPCSCSTRCEKELTEAYG